MTPDLVSDALAARFVDASARLVAGDRPDGAVDQHIAQLELEGLMAAAVVRPAEGLRDLVLLLAAISDALDCLDDPFRNHKLDMARAQLALDAAYVGLVRLLPPGDPVGRAARPYFSVEGALPL